MTNNEYWFWICNIEGVWREGICRLIEEFGTPEAAFNCDNKEFIKRVEKIAFYKSDVQNKKTSENIIKSRNKEKIKEKYEQLEKKDIHFICIDDEEYPDRLKHISYYPYSLYYKGDINELNRPSVAIVGARSCTKYGAKNAKEIGFELAAGGINVISGLAHGIDSYGLWGAVEGQGYSVAVMGCGADVCYPRENIELYERILERGCIISEYPIGRQPISWQFPLRNRIISGLADKIVVVEAKERSGSLITAEYGLEQGKDIMAVPGRMDDILSNGCNRLIKDGAEIITSSRDVLENIGSEYGSEYGSNSKISEKKQYLLEKDLETLYSCVGLFPKNIQQLMEDTGKDSVEIIQKLIKLQMMNLIEEPTKNYYSRKI